MVRKVKDLTGKRFHDLTVKSYVGVAKHKKQIWRCKCDCGEEIDVPSGNLKSGNTKSCGCRRRRPCNYDISGKRFGRLRAVCRIESNDGIARWECICDCGEKSIVTYGHLSTGHTKSCGCLSSEISAKLAEKNLGGKKEKHPRWAGGFKKRPSNTRTWSKHIVRMNGYSCVNCFSRIKPVAHHILGYRDNPERRTDLDNGVCLCAECHIKFHRKYGYTGFSRDDLFEFSGMSDPGDWCMCGEVPNGLIGDAIRKIANCYENGNPIEDLKKARWYLDREIARREKEAGE